MKISRPERFSVEASVRKRRRSWPVFAVTTASAALMTHPIPASAIARLAPSVVTEHNDNARTGLNNNETTLAPANVNQTQFGKLFAFNLDDQSYSQPLFLPQVNMSIDNALHNVVYVTTVNNSVYAFDGDSNLANGGAPLWHVNLTPSGARPPNVRDADAQGACGGGYTDFSGQYGIVGTPVIDASTQTLYVVARTVENGAFVQRLHALSCSSGAEKFGGPVVISGSYAGTTFDPALNNQRPALTLVNGIVYIAWSSHCDNGAYHGFIMGYNASTLQQTAVWSSTNANGGQAGIWQGGQGVTADNSGNLYLMTGNGTWDGNGNYGESFVKLSPALTVLDYFTPSNYGSLNGADADLGASGCLAVPGTSLIFGGGKQGTVYLLDGNNLGRENATDAVVQEFQATFPQNGNTGHIHGGPVYFNSANGQFIYLWGENDFLHAYRFSNGAAVNQGTINSTPIANSAMRAPVTNAGMPGGFLSVSANNGRNGIVWAYTPYNGDANHGSVPGILHAFDAQNFTNGALTELWNSEQDHARDSLGNFAKFTYPTIAKGKVYVSTFGSASSGSGQLIAYGEGPSQITPPPVITPGGSLVPQSITMTDAIADTSIYYTTDGAVPSPGAADTFLYRGPFTQNSCATVTAVAIGNQPGWLMSSPITAAFTSTGPIGSGTGLTGTYFSNIDLSGSSVSRVDPTVNFVWPGNNTSPATGVGPDNWSARWSGFIQPEFTDTYTFTTVTDDGVRLWVNDKLIIDDWVPQAPTAVSGSIALTAGQKYDIKMEYYQAGGGAQAQLYWQSSCQGQQIVPATQLYPATPQVSTPVITPGSGQYNGTVSVSITDSTAGATIHYTTDGSTPTASSPVYAAGFTVPAGTQVQAIGILAGNLNSSVASSLYEGALPSPWKDIDLGSVGQGGSAYWASGTFYQTGSGDDIWNNADAFNFIYQPLTGDGTLTARIVNMGDTDSWSKAGVMIRGSLTATSTHGFAAVTAGNGVVFQDRETDGAASNNWGGPNAAAPYWVRIARSGNTVTGSASPDGINWTTIQSDTISLPSTAYIGIALTAHNNGLLNNAQIDSVTITSPQVVVPSSAPAVVAPVIQPGGGTQVGSASVTITDATPGAVTYFTLDGSAPVPGASTTHKYTGPFTVKVTTIVTAVATHTGYAASAPATDTLTIQTPVPAITPNGGSHSVPVSVTISDGTPGAAIYYTVNGSDPAPGSHGTATYTGAFTVAPGTTVRAIAIAMGQTRSDVAVVPFQ